MQRTTTYISLILLAAGLVLAIAACSDEETVELTVDEIIDRGKQFLVDGDGVAASEAFEAALFRDPENLEARYGIILSNTMQTGSIVDELIELLGDMDFTSDDMEPLGDMDPLGDKPSFSDELQRFIDTLLVDNMRQADQMFIELDNTEDPRFDLESYLLLFLGTEEPLIAWSGEFDRGELYFLGAVNSLLMGVLDLVLAHELDIDIANLNLPEFPTGDDDDDDDGGIIDDTLIETIDILMQWIYDLLNDPDHPNLLYLDSDGVGRMQGSGVELGSGILRFMALIDYTQAEAAQGRADGNVYWDDVLGLVLVKDQLALEPLLVEALKPLLLNLNVALFDTTAFDVDPTNPNPFDIASANELLIYLSVLPEDFRLPSGLITIDIGPWFQDPDPDGLRSLLLGLVDIWDLIKQLLELF